MSATERRYGDAPPEELVATLRSLRALAELMLETDVAPAALARVHASLETTRTELDRHAASALEGQGGVDAPGEGWPISTFSISAG